MKKDRSGNARTLGLPYARGELITSIQDDIAKLRNAWTLMQRRIATRAS